MRYSVLWITTFLTVLVATPTDVAAQEIEPFECGTDDDPPLGPGFGPVAFQDTVRAIFLFVRFRDDDWGDCGQHWCEMPDWPFYEDHWNQQDTIPKEELPDWAHTVVHPTLSDFPASPIPLPASSPIPDSSLSAYFWQQTWAGPNGPHVLYGDVLPENENGVPEVYVTKHPTEHYYTTQKFGDLTEEILDHLDSLGVDFSDYDADNDGFVDQVFMRFRRALYQDENGEWIGLQNNWGQANLRGQLSARGGPTSLTYDGAAVDLRYFASGHQSYNNRRAYRTFVHEYVHNLLLMGHIRMIGPDVNDVPYVLPPPEDLGWLACGYSTMCGKTPSSNYSQARTFSGWELRRGDWQSATVLDPNGSDINNIQAKPLYGSGDVFQAPLRAGSAGDTLSVENRQRNNFFDSQAPLYPYNPNFDVIWGDAQTTGLLVTLSNGDPRGSAASAREYDIVPADNEHFPRDRCVSQNPNVDWCYPYDEFEGDMHKPSTFAQISPWTRPNVSGYTFYSKAPVGFEPNWFAITNIHHTGDPDSTMAFDFIADVRDGFTITKDSWIGEETSGSTLGQTVIEQGTLRIESGVELAFNGDLIVGENANLAIESGAVLRFAPDTRLVVQGRSEALAQAPGAPAPEQLVGEGVTFTATNPGLGWEGIYFEKGSTALLTNSLITEANCTWGNCPEYGAAITAFDAEKVVLSGTEVSGNGASGVLSMNGAAVFITDESFVENNTGTGVIAASGGYIEIDELSIVQLNDGNGVSSSGYGSNVVLHEARIVGNAGVGVVANDQGEVFFARPDPSGNPQAESRVLQNQGGLLAETGGSLIGGISDGVGCVRYCGNRIEDNSLTGPFDAKSVGGSALYAEANFWDVSDVKDLVLVEDGSSFLSVEPILTAPPSLTAGSPSRGTSNTKSGHGSNDFNSAEELAAETLRAYRLDEITPSQAATAITDAFDLATDENSRQFVSTVAAHLLANGEFPQLLTALEAHTGENDPWMLRPLVMGYMYIEEMNDAEETAAILRSEFENSEHALFGHDAGIRLALSEENLDLAEERLEEMVAAYPEAEATHRAALLVHLAGGAVSDQVASSNALGHAANTVGETTELRLGRPVPNPTTGRARLDLDLPTTSHVDARLFDVLGREVAKIEEGDFETGSHALILAQDDLAAGIYVVRVLVTSDRDGIHTLSQRLTVTQ